MGNERWYMRPDPRQTEIGERPATEREKNRKKEAKKMGEWKEFETACSLVGLVVSPWGGKERGNGQKQRGGRR